MMDYAKLTLYYMTRLTMLVWQVFLGRGPEEHCYRRQVGVYRKPSRSQKGIACSLFQVHTV